jgi:uncharacterized damage-inducible protein DinB
MKNLLSMYARYIQTTDETVLDLVGRLSVEDREKERGSYYKSLSGLARHILFGSVFFHGLFRAALPAGSKAIAALEPAKDIKVSDGPLDAAGWTAFVKTFALADAATVKFTDALDEAQLELPVAVPFYGGNPATIPLYFLFDQLLVHTVHHQGQISQILDELKVEHNFTSIPVGLLRD